MMVELGINFIGNSCDDEREKAHRERAWILKFLVRLIVGFGN